jgi:Na+-transporting methylmalonyl-CoA/oxaloacetate decarboxylase gamma subunit
VLLNEDEPPEPIIDGVIDLGAVTLEFLALVARSLSAQARRRASIPRPAPETPAESPFAALAAAEARRMIGLALALAAVGQPAIVRRRSAAAPVQGARPLDLTIAS